MAGSAATLGNGTETNDMAIHWKIIFKPIRTDDTYTVNIYDAGYSGAAVPLKGGAQPFTTQEDDDDDMFVPIRTQTGYLRIVDDGKDADGNAWNWKTLLPTTDTDRPVTLTNSNGDVLWQGFMQARNFGGVLYGNPQEREFPVQCALTVLEGFEINYLHNKIENFSYLLEYIIGRIPSPVDIDNIYIHGGTDAQAILLKRIDWQNFGSEDSDGNMIARLNLYECLEDFCRFWGFTARTFGKDLYLTAIDDVLIRYSYLKVTREQLTAMSSGTAAGVEESISTNSVSGDVFASVDNYDFRQRGFNKAVVKADCNRADGVILGFTKSLENLCEAQGVPSTETVDGGMVSYTPDLTEFSFAQYTGECTTGSASFNVAKYMEGGNVTDGIDAMVLRIKKSYSGSVLASIELVYEHCYSRNVFQLSASIYRGVKQFTETVKDEWGQTWGKYSMWIRLGIGTDRQHAKWLTGYNSWSSTPNSVKVYIGGDDSVLKFVTESGSTKTIHDYIFIEEGLCGKMFIDFLGSDDLEMIGSERSFDIADFEVNLFSGDIRSVMSLVFKENTDLAGYREYSSKNANNVRNEFNADCIFASNDLSLNAVLAYGFGILINPDGTFMDSFNYLGLIGNIPEKHLAKRVTDYWAASKRKLEIELRTDIVSGVTPHDKTSVDGTTCYPIAIGHEWRDDVTKVTLMEV